MTATTTIPGTVVGQMCPHDLQETNERRFSKKHINGYIDTAIRSNVDSEAQVRHGVLLLEHWLASWKAPWTTQCSTEYYYKLKNARLEQLANMELESVVRTVFICIAYFQRDELYVSVTSQLAVALGFADHRESILTTAEVVAVLHHTGAFTIIKASSEASLMIHNSIPLPLNLLDAMARSQYLPPMVCPPNEVTTNFESGHLTFNEPLILGKNNSHVGDQCLDVINIQNAITYKLDLDFLSNVEEMPTFELDTFEKHQEWYRFKGMSYETYGLMAQQGNQFYLPNKPDKRGRLYCQGYYITTQGSAFKKAMLELNKQELVEGVPTCKHFQDTSIY